MHIAPHVTPDPGWMGDRSRGAGMGRPSPAVSNLDPEHRIQLFRVRLDSGGYDAGGAYWGHGQRLYCAMDHNGWTHYFRASNRDTAKQYIRYEHDTPEMIHFYR
ncbi:hypothetical protein [Methylobacterium brachiatum]|uniref:hypothetical protein n=1 Tax=Methylobacterium brachiatum TaxID=269660 RepID=UPI0008DF03AF|nr:hypothetical protein [Methylobacterium brachiatum]SFI05427.1 hypothetical protein SAMN02799642_00559 [Methylobacterium brachiatum]